MNASRIFRNFLNVSQTTEDTDLDTPLTPEETTNVIGYFNFHYGLEEHVVRAMFGTPGLIPEDFLNKYDPDSKKEVSEFLGDLAKEDVTDFLDAVAATSVQPATELELLEALANPGFAYSTPATVPVVTNKTIRLNKKFKGR